MSKNVCIIVLIGLPAAGKSTFCRWLLEAGQTQFNIVHFCYDDFFDFHQLPVDQTTTIDYIYKEQRGEIFDALKVVANALMQSVEIPEYILRKMKISGTHASTRDHIILCDDNHYYRSMRYKVYQLCKAESYGYAQIYFECEQHLSMERNANRPLKTCVPDHVIEQMNSRLESPLGSNIWESCLLTICAEDLKFSMDAVLSLVSKAFRDVQERNFRNFDQKIIEQQETSLIHTLDLKLRRRITDLLLTEQDKGKKRLKAIKLNMKRKEILQKCREDTNLSEKLLEQCVDILNKNF